ncbi:hypothetical protein QBC43DRAFT_213484, partial [Cladorrhinum sp. PSN259]
YILSYPGQSHNGRELCRLAKHLTSRPYTAVFRLIFSWPVDGPRLPFLCPLFPQRSVYRRLRTAYRLGVVLVKSQAAAKYPYMTCMHFWLHGSQLAQRTIHPHASRSRHFVPFSDRTIDQTGKTLAPMCSSIASGLA